MLSPSAEVTTEAVVIVKPHITLTLKPVVVTAGRVISPEAASLSINVMPLSAATSVLPAVTASTAPKLFAMPFKLKVELPPDTPTATLEKWVIFVLVFAAAILFSFPG
jgi:hypothetical protein